MGKVRESQRKRAHSASQTTLLVVLSDRKGNWNRSRPRVSSFLRNNGKNGPKIGTGRERTKKKRRVRLKIGEKKLGIRRHVSLEIGIE